MAKRKSAAALFEVIHADKRFTSRHEGGGSGGWSFRAPKIFSWFSRGRESGDVTSDVTSSPSQPSRLWSLLPSMPRIGFDPDRQVIQFQLTYTSAGVAVFGVVIALALAYVVGKQSGHRPGPALAEQTTDELRNGPVQPDVLNVATPDVAMATAPLPADRATSPAPTTPSAKTSGSASAVASAANQGARNSNLGGSGATTIVDPKPSATGVSTDSHRTAGLQYVVIQSYPPEEKQMAEDAVKLLNTSGILCTIEQIPYAPRWYSVVGITGFTRTKDSPEYDRYLAAIEKASENFAKGSKFKRFEPKPYRWKDAKSAAAKPE
jgi:hypothetical protein